MSRDQRGGQRFREHRGNEGLLVCGMHITGIERETHKTGTKRDSEDVLNLKEAIRQPTTD